MVTVMEILSHINKRVKHRPEISLPMLDLWKIYTESASSSIVRNFCIVYIEMAFERLPSEEKGNIAPDLLINISNVPAQHQGIILRLVSKAIGECNMRKVDDTVASKYRSISGSDDGLVFADFCFHSILYQTPSQGIGCPAGLSVAQADRVTGKLPLKGDTLTSRKLGILNVLEAMQLASEIVYPIYLAGASDSQESVAKRGDELLKRKASTANLEDPKLIKKLFTLFNGTASAENIAAELKVAPAPSSLRVRLMSVFCRSIAAANAFPYTLQCIFGCIYGSGTTSRLKQLGMEFTVWVFKHAVMDQLKLIGPVILSGILRSLDGSSTTEADSTGRDVKIFAYQAIGLLASRLPNLFSNKTEMAVRLFTALRLEDQSLRLTIQEAATSLATAYKGASKLVLKDLEVLLLENSQVISEELVEKVVDILVKVVESEGSTLASIAMESIGHIGLRCALPCISRNSSAAAVLTILHERLTKLLSENDTKAIQKILVSLGHISWNELSFSHLKIALDLIFGLARSKVEDVLFASGEALSFIWGEVPVTADVILETNFVSLSQATNFLTGDAPLLGSSNLGKRSSCEEAHTMAQEEIINKLFDTLIYSSRKEERCAGTVCLVSLTMYCGRHPKILELLPQIQEAFSHLIGDSNELTQDLASQGMSIVYELGDASMKGQLVHALVNTLTGAAKKKKAVKLMEDSEVFQEGTIGSNPTGGKLSTYKELCSLANEMGQPDLIYKFMDLANYQAALNSKRGAAFGFSKIAKQAGEALQPHLHTLIPRLVRYQYDPDKNIQDSMGHIWKLIVADPKKAIDDHYDVIVEDLLVQSGSRLWRSREASCLALADIIQGRRYSQVSKHLRKIWTTTFRAMDDIKETVRNAGDSLCRAVSSLTIRLCDVSLTNASDAKETMNIVLPYLLSEGILSKVSSVQKASISLVMKLAKGAGSALRPHLSELVSCMLECLSSLEDQRLNYVEMHAGSAGIQTEKLDSSRVAVAKDSPMWETLDICIKVVDTNSLELLIPRLAQMVRSAVGLNTRVGVANFITLLVQKVMINIKPYTAMLLKLLYTAVLEERSSAAKRAFASSCASVLKYASQSQAQKLIEDTASLHLGEKNSQLSGAVLIKSYLSNAADVISGYNAVVIPVIFSSRFDDDKETSALYGELWEDIPSSERVTLQLYLPEIVIMAFKDPGFFNSVFPMLCEASNQSVISKTRASSSLTTSAADEQDESASVSVSLDKVLNCVASSITIALPQDIIHHKKNMLEVLLNSLSPEEGWQVKLSSFLCIKEVCYKFLKSDGSMTWPQGTDDLVQEMFHSVASKVVDSIRLVKIAQVHIAASECLLELIKLYRDFPLTERRDAMFEGELIQLCESEKSEQAKALLKQCLTALKDLTGVTMVMG
uniref:Uncharacterized protein n=1 Tax=Avena sativa TaxID=4498 RepID=A0ACD5YHL8_AVESA